MHILGAAIAGRGRRWPWRQMEFAQLGTMMIRNNGRAQVQALLPEGWHRTNFVLAAEIDSHERATSLWLLHNPLLEPVSQALQQYPMFDLYTLKKPLHTHPHDIHRSEHQVFRIQCGEKGWRQRTEAERDGGLGLVGLTSVVDLEPVHYVRVVQSSVTGHFRHATWILVNRIKTNRKGLPRPIWVCEGYPGHRLRDCPALVPPEMTPRANSARVPNADSPPGWSILR